MYILWILTYIVYQSGLYIALISVLCDIVSVLLLVDKRHSHFSPSSSLFSSFSSIMYLLF